jgi:hypothetical protein
MHFSKLNVINEQDGGAISFLRIQMWCGNFAIDRHEFLRNARASTKCSHRYDGVYKVWIENCGAALANRCATVNMAIKKVCIVGMST